MTLTRKSLLRLAGAALATPALNVRAATPSVVNVTYVTAPFNVPSIVMRAKGFLDEAFGAKDIRIVNPVITSGAAQFQAIAAGAIDIASVLGDTSAIIGRANGVDLRVISAFARSPKAYTIMARADGPATIEALKGRKVGGPKGTVLNQLLAAALASKGLKLTDIEYINMDLGAARAALLSGQIDAATLAGSDQLAAEAAGAKVLTTGDGLVAPTTVIAARGGFLAEHPDLVELYLSAHRKALDFMKANPEEALQLAATEQKTSIEDARRVMPLYDFSPTLTAADVRNMEAAQAFLVEAGMLTRTIDITRDLLAPMARPAA